MKVLNIIANVIWFFVGGLFTAIAWFITGLLLCITIVGIPFGVQNFKFAKFSLCPFGKKIQLNFSKHPIANIIWLLLVGWEMCLVYFLAALICCVTIIGIPVGVQAFKFCTLSVAPFGADIK
jgi:uncharacterized membrane protein YccF (DUF307 family)